MKLFFPDDASLESFAQSLPVQQGQTQCTHCLKQDQFVSHSWVYRQRSMTKRVVVGKRLFCSNRYGRSGCGRTVQLMIADCIPHLHYPASVVSRFITRLFAQDGISHAYRQATGQFETRHAWRWIAKLMAQLSQYRCTLKTRAPNVAVKHRSKALSLLLPTLRRLTLPNRDDKLLCAAYQLQHQRPFI